MSINLDLFKILNLELGSQSDMLDGTYQRDSVSFQIKDSYVNNIYVRISEFYSKGETYEGSLIINGSDLFVNENFQPENIISHFSTPIEQWNDGVEVNYRFKVDNVYIECSWHWNAEKLVPNYLGIEIDEFEAN